jgi:hypothetical protein
MIRRPYVMATAAVLTLGLFGASVATRGAAATGAAIAGSQAPVAGHGNTNTPRQVDVSSLPDATATRITDSRNLGALRRDGSRTSQTRQAAPPKPAVRGAPTASQPTRVLQNFAGTLASQSSCGCQPPDSNGAVNGQFVVETDNLTLQAWTKTTPPTLKKRISFNAFLGTSDSLSDPRVLYDNAYNRWVLAIIPIPATTTSTPRLWFAVSKTSNPTKTWSVYNIGFGGGQYVPGALLDYPMVGMDADSIAITTNNFKPGACTGGFCYNGSAVFAMPKQRLYNGLGFGFGAFGVGFSAHPSFVEGIPQNQDGRHYIVASQTAEGNGSGFDVWYMLNGSRPDSTTVTFAGATAATGDTKPNCAPQPGGGTCLDALDGRLQAAPHQLNGLLWFARTSGFPLIRYGTINESSLAVTEASAFVAGSSNDWNPSIGVSDAGGGNQFVFLNWAYDNPGAGTQVSTRVAGLSAGDAVQNLLGVGTTLATGGHGNDSRFGDFSSVSIDPSASGPCAAGRSALIENEEFSVSTGEWQMRDARVGFC